MIRSKKRFVVSKSDLKATHFKYEKIGMENKKKNEPVLYLMNHSSFIDLKIAGTIIYPEPFNIVRTADANSGVGTIGLIAAKNAKRVISVESNKSAHFNAIENAKRNNINNIEFICDDASEYIANCDEELDVVIMDPPRSGSDKKFLSALINKKIKKIIYVSCNPETLARDVAYLSEYYKVTFVQPVDMFPMTADVETIVSLLRNNNL